MRGHGAWYDVGQTVVGRVSTLAVDPKRLVFVPLGLDMIVIRVQDGLTIGLDAEGA